MRRKINRKSVYDSKSSNYMKDPKFNQIPVVNIVRCNFEDFIGTSLSRESCNIRNFQRCKLPRNLNDKKISGPENLKYLKDTKLNQIPDVNVESNCEEVLDNELKRQLSKTNCKMRNLQYMKLPENLNDKNLSKPVNSRRKRNITMEPNGNTNNSSVDVRKCIMVDQEKLGGKNYEAKRKRDDLGSNRNSFGFIMEQKKLNDHGILKCSEGDKNKGNQLKSILQSNKKTLRERKKVDYTEKLSIGTLEITANPVHSEGVRIPIYKRLNSIQTPSNERKHDQYNFIPDSDEEQGSDVSFHLETQPKKRKVVKMLHICKKKADTAINQEKKSKKIDNLKYDDKIKYIMNNIKNKINVKTGNNTKTNEQKFINQNNQYGKQNKNDLLIKNIKNPVVNMEIIFNSTPGREAQNIPLPNESPISLYKGVKTDNNMCMQQNLNTKFKQKITPTDTESLISCNQVYSKETKLNECEYIDGNVALKNIDGCAVEASDVLSGNSSPACNYDGEASDSFEDRDHVSNEGDNIDNIFGFLKDLEENNQGSPVKSRINIIQNVQLRKSNIQNKSIAGKEQPTRNSWRLNDCITRNPHFVVIKNSGLPSLNQDPVLDHTFDARISEHNMTLVPCSKKSLKQKSILNFVETDKEDFAENVHHTSLFNIEEYSPIKVNPADKENSDGHKTQFIKRTTRRNVLGEINNIMTGNTSTPAKSITPSGPIPMDVSLIECEKGVDSSKNFGFDTCFENTETNEIASYAKNTAKPFRLDVNFERRKQPEKLSGKLVKPVRDSEVVKLVGVGEDPDFSKLIESEGLECEKVGLFEDADTSQNVTKCYKARTKTKFAARQDNPKKKNTECKLSKEAKKWIKEFNQMCEEVENVELEME